MAELKLSDGSICLVDNEDFEPVSKWKWKLHTGGYACRSAGKRDGRYITVLMHRFILDAPVGMEVDHLNGRKLDNRRSNLQLIDPTEHRKKHAHILVEIQKARQIYPDIKPCANCGVDFKVNPRKRKRNKCCSPSCAMAMRIEGRMRQLSRSSR